MLYARQANGSVDEVVSRLADTVAAHKFGVMGVHNLKQKMAERDVAFGPGSIFEACNPHQAKKIPVCTSGRATYSSPP